MTTLGTRNGLTRLTLSSIFSTCALGAVLVTFACGDNGTTNTNPNPDMTTDAPADMTVVPGAPTLTSVTPKLVSTAGGTSVTLSGSNFKSGATVKLGAATVPASDVTVGIDGNSIIIKVPMRLGMAGKVDVSVTNSDNLSVSSTGALTYFLGQSSFGTATPVAADRGPRCIIVAKMDGNDNLDLVTANFNASNVSVLVGDGLGGFTNKINRGSDTGPYSVAVGDINGDEKLDVISANQTTGSVSVMLGDGTGNLNAPVSSTSFLGNGPQSVVIVDINNDGAMDLVVNNFINTTNNVSLLMGDKTTSFSRAGSTMITANGGNLYSLITGDFNADGKLDVIGAHKTTTAQAKNVSTLINQGKTAAPFFTIGGNKSTGDAPKDAMAVAAGDFDNDGKKDIVVANNGSGSVSFLKGDGAGAFTDSPAGSVFAVGSAPEHLAVLDVNQDGNLDIVTANFGAGNVSLLLGKGDGSFEQSTVINAGANVKPNWVAVGDFNKDGRIDLAVTDYNTVAASGRVMILLNTSQ